MKNTFSKTITTSVIAMLVLSMLAAFPLVKAQPTIWVDPATVSYDTNAVSIGDYFLVQVKVTNPTAWNLMMFQVTIKYKQAYLAPSMKGTYIWAYPSGQLGVSPPESWDTAYVFYGSSGTVGNPSLVDGDPTWDGIMLGETLLADKAMTGGATYILAQFNFTIIAVPSKYQTFDSLLDINNDGTFMYDSAGAIIVGPHANIANGQYTLAWAPPPAPEFAIVNATGSNSLTFWKGTNWVGTTFNMYVYLNDLNAAWDATNATVTLSYDNTVIDILAPGDVVVDAAWTVTSVTLGTGTVTIFVDAYATPPPSGDVLIATITFTIVAQNTAPDPDLYSAITFDFTELWDHVNTIGTTSVDAEVTVQAYQAAPDPYYVVIPPLVEKGPEPVIGQEFDVEIQIVNLSTTLSCVGLQFKLTYDPDLLEFVSATEGPFMTNPIWNWYGTFFVATVSPYPNPGVNIGNLLLPNGIGEWDQTEFPNTVEELGYDVGVTLAIIRFRVIKQIYPYTFECPLNVVGIGGVYAVNNLGNPITFDEGVFEHGYYRVVTTPLPGRVIDVYGGAENDGYGTFPDPFPAPYGGQGPNMPMDLVFPQSEIILYTNLTYNYWPVQRKDVGFEVEGPYDHLFNETSQEWYYAPKPNHFILLKESARTDENGVAFITFAMPWPCDNPEDLLGVWKVTVTGDIRDMVCMDTLYFYYDYVVHIWKVTTDKYSYVHCETVTITIKYGTHSMQYYPALFSSVIKDELNVPIGMALTETMVGGAVFCQYLNSTIRQYIHIPKFAFAGYAHVYVNVFDKDPTDGGKALYHQYEPKPEIFIQPY